VEYHADDELSRQYSGVKEGRPSAMVLRGSMGAINRGACIKDLSQYPGEVLRLLSQALIRA
jgi:hypothetical protein